MYKYSREQFEGENTKYFDYIVFVKYTDIPQKLEEITAKLQISQSRQNFLKLVKLEFIVLLLAHIACCIFLRIGLSEMNNQDNSWITKYQFENSSTFELYLLSLYYVIITMTTIGYGDITPASQYERMFIAVVALIATNICAYSFSQINEIVKYEKQKNDTFNTMMQGLNADMNKLELEMSLQHRVRKYFEFQFKQDIEKGQGQDDMLDQLPSSLRNEVLIQTNNEAVQSIGLFASFSPDCQKELALNIKQKFYKPDEIIFSENETNDKLYYIISGNVQATIGINLKYEKGHNQNAMLLQTLTKKDVFGYEGFLLGQLNPYTAKSFKGTMISYLEIDKLIQILQAFPSDKEQYFMFKDSQLFKMFSYKDMSKSGNKGVPNQQKFSQIEINHCVACGSSNHTLKKCHIVQLNLRYKKDKRTYNQDRLKECGIRSRVVFYKSILHNKQIQNDIINFKMVQDQNSIMSDVYSVLYSDEDDNTTNKYSKKTNEEYDNEDYEEGEYEVEDEKQQREQSKRKTIKQQSAKKQTQINYQYAKELLDVYRRKSQRDISNKFELSPKSQQASISNLQAIDEDVESDKDTYRTRQKKLQEKEDQIRQLNIQSIINELQTGKKESIYIANSNEKIESGFNVTPKLNNDKGVSIENNVEVISKQSSKKPTFKSRTNTKNHSSQYSNRKLTNQSVSSNHGQKTFTTIANEYVAKTNQNIPINVRTSSGNIEIFNNEELPPLKKLTQLQKRFSKESSSDENCNLKNDDDNQMPSNSAIENKRQVSLQQKIAIKRRMKQEQTYIEDEIKMRNMIQQSLLAPQEFNFFTYLQQPSSQGKIELDDDMALPSPAQLQYRKYKQGNNQVMFDLQSDPSMSPSLIESKNRKSLKKITQSSMYRHENVNPEQRLSIIGLNKSNSVLYRQPSLANKLNQDTFKDPVSSPLSQNGGGGGGGGNKKLNQQTAFMIQSSPSINSAATDYRIRFEYGIQNIDYLVIRKYMMLEQMKGNIRDYIFVQDNEIDIDKMRKFKVYFPRGNYNYIIKKIRMGQDRFTKTKFPTNSGVLRQGARVSKIKPLLGSLSQRQQNSKILSGFGNNSTSRISILERDK